MELLRAELKKQFANEPLLKGEKDVLVMGDFNADRYDNHVEDFWVNYDSDGFQFKTMSPEHGEDYHLVSRIYGPFAVLGVFLTCDTGLFPLLYRCESHRTVWSPLGFYC